MTIIWWRQAGMHAFCWSNTWELTSDPKHMVTNGMLRELKLVWGSPVTHHTTNKAMTPNSRKRVQPASEQMFKYISL